jgi:general secretion pathway protein E
VVDEAIRREILNNSDANKLSRVAVSRGMISLRVDGVRQVLAGRTSMEEILAATHDAEIDME